VIPEQQGGGPVAQRHGLAGQIGALGGRVEGRHHRVGAVLDEEIGEAVDHVLGPRPPAADRRRLGHDGLEPLDARLQHGPQNGVLGPEVVVNRRFGQRHLVGDQLERGGVVAALGEQALRGLQDLLPGLLGLQRARRCRPGRRRHRVAPLPRSG
jgi:hypothetical protein